MVEHQKQELKKKLQHLPNPLLSEDEEALVTRIVEEFVLDVPTLVEADLYATEKQVQIDARTLRNRVVFDHSRPVYVAATQITVHIPFRGDAGMFEVQPSTYTMNPPIGEIHDGEIHLIYEIADASISITDQYKRTLGEIRQHLEALRPTAEQLNTDLKHLVRSLLAKRKHEATAHSQLVGSLGIPVRKAAPIAATPATPASSGARLKQTAPKKSPPARKDAVEWDVFISHASEDKEEFARPLAEALRAKGLRVWFDEFTLTLGDSLRQSIDLGLSRSRFGVVIFSPKFFEKHLPTQELNGLATREVDGKKVILPVWHKVGFEDVRKQSPTLADKFAIQSDQGIGKVVDSILGVLR